MRRDGTTIERRETTREAERVLIELARQAPMWRRAEQWSNLIHARRVLITHK
ncbi:MAG TPA: hypothetical protein VGC89_12615 [Pyrinomonadaceae bacterium]